MAAAWVTHAVRVAAAAAAAVVDWGVPGSGFIFCHALLSFIDLLVLPAMLIIAGLDMTPVQLDVAQQHCTAWQQQLGYASPNMRFLQGKIEELAAAGIAPGSIDLIISNCVINLSPDKAAVLSEAYQALADGGEVFFSGASVCAAGLPLFDTNSQLSHFSVRQQCTVYAAIHTC
jgi:SAM-dependent methyltransferase